LFSGELIKGEVYKRKLDTPDELLAGISDSVARTKKREYQLRRTTRDIPTVTANLMVGFSNIYFKFQKYCQLFIISLFFKI
jgi:hypothetical protein